LLDIRTVGLTKIFSETISHAIVEESIEAQIGPGDIEADYTVYDFAFDSIFYPTSISLCETDTHRVNTLSNTQQ
jgi:hypothetical protein